METVVATTVDESVNVTKLDKLAKGHQVWKERKERRKQASLQNLSGKRLKLSSQTEESTSTLNECDGEEEAEGLTSDDIGEEIVEMEESAAFTPEDVEAFENDPFAPTDLADMEASKVSNSENDLSALEDPSDGDTIEVTTLENGLFASTNVDVIGLNGVENPENGPSTSANDTDVNVIGTTVNKVIFVEGSPAAVENFSGTVQQLSVVNQSLQNKVNELASKLQIAFLNKGYMKTAVQALHDENKQLKSQIPSLTARKSYKELSDSSRAKRDIELLEFLKLHVRGPRCWTEADDKEQLSLLLKNLLKRIEK